MKLLPVINQAEVQGRPAPSSSVISSLGDSSPSVSPTGCQATTPAGVPCEASKGPLEPGKGIPLVAPLDVPVSAPVVDPLAAPSELTLSEGIKKLETHRVKGKPSPAVNPAELPLRDIQLIQAVFQRRQFEEGTSATSEDHVRGLMDATMTESRRMLDPVVVWWSGIHWFILDGHHRVLAYRRLADMKKLRLEYVPVVVFQGSLARAIAEATRLNAKDKLPMTKADKLNSAWKLVVFGGLSLSEIANAAKVAVRTVSTMRERLRIIQEKYPSRPLDAIINVSWVNAQRDDATPPEHDDSWEQQMAADWAKRLARTFGTLLATQPGIAAMALEIYSEKLPAKLVEEWRFVWHPEGDSDF